MRFCFSLVFVVLAACSAEQDFVPAEQPVPQFDWRVYNGPSHSTPWVRIEE